MEYILEMKDIYKSFSGVQVLKNVSLKVRPGEVHALMGENGAGKSTLMKILMGMYKSDKGGIFIDGKPIKIHDPKEALIHGISMIHQELNPVLDMEVAENIFLGREMLNSKVKGLKIIDRNGMRQETARLFKEMNIDIDPKATPRSLSVAQMQLVEIVKAISLKSKIIIMDEPTSAITDKEVTILFEQINKLKNQGVAIIYISHKMDEIFKISDAITVLRDGSFVGTGSSSELTQEKLIKMMVGREIEEVYPKEHVEPGPVLLKVEKLTRKGKIKNISFEVKSGEILGIAGLMGSGRSETAETIFGIYPATSGSIWVKGNSVKIKHPKDAIDQKIALVTEDRKQTGLNLLASVENNISMVALDKISNHKILSKDKEAKAADQYIDELNIKTHSRKTKVSSLSGGNQQKVVLGKWLLEEPEIIIFDEPTRGVDVGAKREIYLLIGKLAKAGKAIVVISSEMPEVMGISDRIMVMNEGRVSGILEREEFQQETIMHYATTMGGTK